MSQTADVIRQLMDTYEIDQTDIAKAAGVSPGAVSLWLSGKRNPKTGALRSIATHFDIPMDVLVPKDGQIVIELPDVAPKKAYAPLVGRVHAGNGSEPDVIDTHVPIPYEVWKNHRSAFLLEVEGDCMNVVLPPGCLVLVDKNVTPANRSIAVVSIDGSDYLVRRLTRGTDTLLLSPESTNNQWHDVVVSEGDGKVVELVGTVVWYQPPEELS